MPEDEKTRDELLRENAELRRRLAAYDAGTAVDDLRRDPHLRLIVDFVRDHAITMLDADGRVRSFNAPAERIKGYRLDEVIGKHFRIFFTEEDRAAGLPERELEVARTQGRFEGEGVRRRKDGTHFTAAVSLSALRDARGELLGFVKVTKDMTSIRAAEDSARAAREQLEVVLQGVGEGITMSDASGHMVYANDVAAQYLGVASTAELLGLTADQFTARFPVFDEAGNQIAQARRPAARAARGERVAGEILRLRTGPGGADRWFAVTATGIGDSRGVRFVVNIFRDVTEARRAEQAVRESERRYRALFDLALDAIVIADDGMKIVEVNDAAASLFGRPREKILGARVSDLVLAPERPSTVQRWEDFQSEGRQLGEIVLARPDGTTRYAEYSAVANFIPGRHLSVLRDITQRREAEESLRFLSEASATLAGSLDYHATLAAVARLCVPRVADWAAVDMLAPDGTIQRLAVAHVDPARVQAAQNIVTRWPAHPDDAAGVAAVIRTGRPAVYPEITDAMLSQGVQDPELLRELRALGLTSSMCVPINARGRTVGAITLAAAESGRRFGARDLTMAEEVARRAGVAVDNATSYREAQEASRIKDEFLATLSHELRTPLTAVLGWATMVRNRASDAQYVARGLEIIERNARAQAQLIEDLLDLSRVVSGKLRIIARPVSPEQVVDAALDAVRPAAAAKNITLAREVEPGPKPVLGDADRLLQVISNLLTNAVKFTPRGGHVGVSVRRSDSTVEIAVRDTGQGIAPEFLPHVFERFRQADATTTRAHGGLGLGLAIARSLVELHGGTILASSEGEGHGAVFTVRLPVAPLSAEVAGAAGAQGAAGGTTQAGRAAAVGSAAVGPMDAAVAPTISLAGTRVLVVDDDADTRVVLVAALEYFGARVVAARSAAEAVTAMRAAPPDVIVSDIGMPAEDGYAFIQRVRALPASEGGRAPAVALTAYASEDNRARATQSGFQDFVHKPVDPAELARRLAAAMARGMGT